MKMRNARNGLLIAFEGIDGTGKSTQIRLLADWLRAQQGEDVLETREPTDSAYGRRIRELYLSRAGVTPEEELELFLQDRQLHVKELIRPALKAGRIVLTDRYYYSTAAYQGANGLDPQDILARNRFAPRPDLVILLTMPPELSAERISSRGEQLNAFEQLAYLRRVSEIFASFSSDPWLRRIDASQSVSLVQEQIRAAWHRLCSPEEP